MSYDVTFALAGNTFAKVGYLFQGWATSASGAVAYGNGHANLRNLCNTQDAVFALYAKWTAISYTVSYVINGGNGGSVANQNVVYDQVFALAQNGYYRNSHTFVGWGNEAGSGANYQPGQQVSNLISVHGGVKTLYAQWGYVSPVEFGYNGGVQSWVAPHTGWYRLEAYGAQGGNHGVVPGGNGGYAAGNVYVGAGHTFLIVVGGMSTSRAGGFNGGGAGGPSGVGGGGCTHIGNAGAGSELKYCQIGNIYCVGGGGNSNYGINNVGGSGGGTNGGNGGQGAGNSPLVTGGTQSGPGSNVTASNESSGQAYGQGGSSTRENNGGGGGGGLYGGAAGGYWGAGAGGSGFAGNGLSSTNLQNGVRGGHGFARITFLHN